MKTYNIKDIDIFLEREGIKHSREGKLKSTIARKEKREVNVSFLKDMGIGSVLCLGARDDSEIKSFIDNDIDCFGIDIGIETEHIKHIDAHKISSFFEENSFDIIYSSHSLEHMYDVPCVLEGVRRISRKGVFIVLPFDKKPSKKHPSIFDIMVNHPDDLESLLEKKELLGDFKELGPYDLKYYRVDKSNPPEVELFFNWSD